MEEGDEEGADDKHKGGLGEDDEDHLDPLLGRGVGHEHDDVDELDEDAGPVDGQDEGAVRVNNGQAVQNPQVTVEEGGEVWDRRELLHIFFLPYAHKSWPACDHTVKMSIKSTKG